MTTAEAESPVASPAVPGTRQPSRWWSGARPHWVFLVVAGVMGTLLAFVTPPFQVPDEPSHMFRAYQISTGVLVSPRMVGDLPASLTQLSAAYERLIFHAEQKATVAETRQRFRMPLNPGATEPVELRSVAIYSPVPYVAQAVGMAVGRWLGWPPVALMYAGRVANAWLYVVLGWTAIRLIPMLKWPACILLTAPKQLMWAGSLSEDPTTLAVVFLAVAIILRIGCDPGVATVGIRLALLAVLVAVGLCKSVYSPVVLLLLAVPASRWGAGWRRWAWPAAAVLAVAAAVGTWSSLASPMNVRQRSANPRAELRWVEYHPGSFLSDLWRSLGPDWDYLALDGVGGRMGWGEFTMSTHFLDALFIVLLWMSVHDDSPERMPLPMRLVALGVGTLFVLAIAVSVFVLWHVKGERTVTGLQGRYFIPVMLLGCVAIRRRRIGGLRPDRMITLLALSCAYTVWVIVSRYYLA